MRSKNIYKLAGEIVVAMERKFGGRHYDGLTQTYSVLRTKDNEVISLLTDIKQLLQKIVGEENVCKTCGQSIPTKNDIPATNDDLDDIT